MRELTQPEAGALAALLHEMRSDWDVPGVRTALWNAKGLAPAPDLMCAAVRAAADGNVRTPAVIAQPGRHWRHETQVQPTFPRPTSTRRCSVCNLGFNDCRAKWSGDHEFESVDDNRRHQTPPPQELRAAVASSRTEASA